mmetsp:Transcript_28180/g.66161  ORF Transcript_28180/g.66161 Transcript_28180/m.66161 type:complete len:238 (+) Transcript_28180:681-1394(+)
MISFLMYSIPTGSSGLESPIQNMDIATSCSSSSSAGWSLLACCPVYSFSFVRRLARFKSVLFSDDSYPRTLNVNSGARSDSLLPNRCRNCVISVNDTFAVAANLISWDGYTWYSIDVTTPRLPPPAPSRPQNRSSLLLPTVSISPLAITTWMLATLSIARPYILDCSPYPPPNTNPPIPTPAAEATIPPYPFSSRTSLINSSVRTPGPMTTVPGFVLRGVVVVVVVVAASFAFVSLL